MNRKTIQRKFKDIDKTDYQAVKAKAVDIFKSYIEKKYGSDHLETEYMKNGIGWSLQQDMLNRQYHDTIYSVAVDWIENSICEYDACEA